MKRKLKWVIEVSVDPLWVADGFEFTKDNVQDHVRQMIRYATGEEVKARVLKAPAKKIIRKLQGYAN